MYWNALWMVTSSTSWRWIVTLDVLKCTLSGSRVFEVDGWIVTLDVLKYNQVWQDLDTFLVE